MRTRLKLRENRFKKNYFQQKNKTSFLLFLLNYVFLPRILKLIVTCFYTTG